MSPEAQLPVLQAVELLDSDLVELLDSDVVELVEPGAVDLMEADADEPMTSEVLRAAELLNGSRPLVALLDSGEFPYRLLDPRKRVRQEDILSYQRLEGFDSSVSVDAVRERVKSRGPESGVVKCRASSPPESTREAPESARECELGQGAEQLRSAPLHSVRGTPLASQE